MAFPIFSRPYLPKLGSMRSPSRFLLEMLCDRSVIVTGWFRRSQYPTIDLSTMQPIIEDRPKQRASLTSHHQFWNNIASSLLVLIGLAILLLTSKII
ncbi:hypothetical protein H6F44_19965 [Pseudanabaena sp. FACHB-1277]|uniref:Uncharacterized protein n=1 Tax=Pseudanabaena cinerea FACHB-1277 TaxID=2949581 RepID=A0A926ZA03_9CYAN|nr:hypothetical protein [Pseudanabaena cinerea]MBD2152374.1 hypothetical protein [Pseudanabaena cinerea FACHB-1277]